MNRYGGRSGFTPDTSGVKPDLHVAASLRRFRGSVAVAGLVLATALAAAPKPDVSLAVASAKADVVVAADGSGQYRSVQEAISAAPMRTGNADARWVILVKPGTYHERIYVQRERGNLLVIGEDAATTIITYDLHANLPGPDGQGIGTFRTPTLQVDGDGMIWENLTIANGAGQPGPRASGPAVAQAVALRVDGDRVVFRHCRFLGWQDTILVNRGRQYFADCYIEGSVDFIFGAATAYFDRCHIHCVGDGYVTAASTPEGAPYGFVFSDCTITGAPGVHTYLGRPWRIYAQTVFVRTEMSDVVRPAGWDNWKKPAAEKTTHYQEFMSAGAGGTAAQRLAWARKPGSGDVARYTSRAVLAGADDWDPAPAPTIHLAGDSTMADKPDLDYPERGWGQAFREFVRPPWQLVNYAANGRSTKSFRDEGRWDLLLKQLKAGDWVIIEFGHNDEKKQDPTRYADPVTAYPANLRRFVADVRARGAHPVLATPVVRRDWKPDGSLGDTHGAYLAAVREVAAMEKVPLLDLEALTRKLETELGVEGSKKLHMIFAPGENPHFPEGHTDNTHYVEYGAHLVAQSAARELARLGLPCGGEQERPQN
ncbi:MAG TPA: pectinesterase family protein [Lacunisphaera sp.]|nr:pectinesterase family protein [Lacunisphaera sp.]